MKGNAGSTMDEGDLYHEEFEMRYPQVEQISQGLWVLVS
jgi:hypothetical protein